MIPLPLADPPVAIMRDVSRAAVTRMITAYARMRNESHRTDPSESEREPLFIHSPTHFTWIKRVPRSGWQRILPIHSRKDTIPDGTEVTTGLAMSPYGYYFKLYGHGPETANIESLLTSRQKPAFYAYVAQAANEITAVAKNRTSRAEDRS